MRSLSLVVIKCRLQGNYRKELSAYSAEGGSRQQGKDVHWTEGKTCRFVNFCFSEREAPVYLTDILAAEPTKIFAARSCRNALITVRHLGGNGFTLPWMAMTKAEAEQKYL